MEKEALQLIQTTAIAASSVESIEDYGMVVVPHGASIKDIETYLDAPRRKRGLFQTSSIDSFVAYVSANSRVSPEGAATSVFIQKDSMSAAAIFNMGTVDRPGHCDDHANIRLKKMAAYESLKNACSGRIYQRELIVFIEDWSDNITLPAEMTISRFIDSVRSITIDANKKTTHVEGQMDRERTEMEKIAAKGKLPLPSFFGFSCTPYFELGERTFDIRLRVSLPDEDPAFLLSIVKKEQKTQDITDEFERKLLDALDGTVDIYQGAFSR